MTLEAVESVRADEIVGAMVGRTRKVQETYHAYLLSLPPGCAFCSMGVAQPEFVVREAGSMLVIRNRFPYAVWDGAAVAEHLMVIPARHLLSLDEYTDAEVMDFFRVIREFEAIGFSVYTRSPHNKSRTVGHVHTHLILTQH